MTPLASLLAIGVGASAIVYAVIVSGCTLAIGDTLTTLIGFSCPF